MAVLFYVICTAWCQWNFLMFLSMNDFLPGCLFAVVIKCFMIGVNVWWVYLAPQNIPRAISLLTLGNKVVLYYLNIYYWRVKLQTSPLNCYFCIVRSALGWSVLPYFDKATRRDERTSRQSSVWDETTLKRFFETILNLLNTAHRRHGDETLGWHYFVLF